MGRAPSQRPRRAPKQWELLEAVEPVRKRVVKKPVPAAPPPTLPVIHSTDAQVYVDYTRTRLSGFLAYRFKYEHRCKPGTFKLDVGWLPESWFLSLFCTPAHLPNLKKTPARLDLVLKRDSDMEFISKLLGPAYTKYEVCVTHEDGRKELSHYHEGQDVLLRYMRKAGRFWVHVEYTTYSYTGEWMRGAQKDGWEKKSDAAYAAYMASQNDK
jgi:hypothetical protein